MNSVVVAGGCLQQLPSCGVLHSDYASVTAMPADHDGSMHATVLQAMLLQQQ